MAYTLADLNEAIAAAVPEREAIVTATRRLTWNALCDRSRRVNCAAIAASSTR